MSEFFSWCVSVLMNFHNNFLSLVLAQYSIYLYFNSFSWGMG